MKNTVDNLRTKDAEDWLMSEIAAGEASARSDGWIDEQDILDGISKHGERLRAFARERTQ
ncbi:MAG: hypothetical protein IJI36_16900 [Kiritimatiellae bacterium]|nr:hypothetical protein [Kiritimatiellia bacterium]